MNTINVSVILRLHSFYWLYYLTLCFVYITGLRPDSQVVCLLLYEFVVVRVVSEVPL
jgi:hypothetical protein